MFSKYKKILILTSSGGGGLLRAAESREQDIHACNKECQIIKKDVMLEWAWWPLGTFGVWFWNTSQKSGQVHFLKLLGWGQFLSEILFWPSIFFKTLSIVFKEEIDHVIDTQPLGTSAIIKALRIFNKIRGKKVYLEKVMSDLPTKDATHFFYSIKKLSSTDKTYLRFVTNEPLLEEEKNNEEFWQKHCKLSEKDITYESLIIRRSFKTLVDKKRSSTTHTIFTKVQSDNERRQLEQVFAAQNCPVQYKDENFSFAIEPSAKVVTILLGSQPSFGGTYNYIKGFIETLENSNDKFFVFAYCEKMDSPLFQSVCALLEKRRTSCNLCIVPMSYQPEEVVANLFFRSDLTITKSGGQTAMELMAISKGACFIHSEAQGSSLSLQQLLSGIPAWEAGGALYLKEKFNAKIVTPETFKKELKYLTQLVPYP